MGGSKDTESDGKRSSKLLNGGAGFRSDVTIAKEPRLGSFLDLGWNSATSQFGHTALAGGHQDNKQHNTTICR